MVHGSVFAAGHDQAVGVLGRVPSGSSTRHGKYLFVYPFVKTRAWYALPADERWRIMQEHIKIGREYPSVDLNTSYSFGLDDQEFVVAFETDNPADFLDLVQRLRTTESSAYTLRDTPTFTCISCSVERALGALDGAALVADAPAAAPDRPTARSSGQREAAGRRSTPASPSPAAADPVLRALIDEVGTDGLGERRVARPRDHYGALVRSIVGQQLSTRAARAIYGRLTERFGGRPPTPEEVLADDPDELRVAAGLSHAKVRYLRSLAEHVLDGSLRARQARPAAPTTR